METGWDNKERFKGKLAFGLGAIGASKKSNGRQALALSAERCTHSCEHVVASGEQIIV